MDLQVIKLAQAGKWVEILKMCYRYDFYHSPSYHEISVDNKNHESCLFAYQEGVYTIAIPLVIRPINEIEGLESLNHNDATSVYGYAGPVASHDTIPDRIIETFQGNLKKYFHDNDIVCTFSRLHPLISQQSLLKGFGNVARKGQTISIDLSLPVDEQYSRYRKNHKRNISKLRQLGAHCINDQLAEHLEDFIAVYHENMQRVGAQEEYLFDKTYFQQLLSAKDFDMHLFTCFLEDDMACGGLVSLCNGIVQYHLGATRSEYLELAPMKLLVDEVRIWANEVGASYLHLGGGYGSEEDSLFKFKAGFSDTVHDFNVWQLVVMKNEYVEICGKKELWNKSRSGKPMNGNYFPIYRSPTT